MSLQYFRKGEQTRQHKTPLSQSTMGTGCCPTAAGYFLPRVRCREEVSQGQRESQMLWFELVFHCHLHLCRVCLWTQGLNLHPCGLSLYSVALEEDAKAVPVNRSSPQSQNLHPLCPEDLAVGLGALPTAGLKEILFAPWDF